MCPDMASGFHGHTVCLNICIISRRRMWTVVKAGGSLVHYGPHPPTPRLASSVLRMQMEGLGQKQGAPPPSMMTSIPHQDEEADNSLHRMNKSV